MTATALVTAIMREVNDLPPFSYTYAVRPDDLLEVRASELEGILLSMIPTPDEWTLAMQVELEEARKEIERLERDNVIYKACANSYAESALRALMEMTGSYNRENPWLGITAAVAVLQMNLQPTGGTP